MISVIIPVYNHARELERCLHSLEKQTFKDFEVIVVDDGSDNGKWQMANSQSQIQYFEIEHGGAPKARNFGFSKSKGEYVIFCDADVVMYPDCLQEMYDALEKNSSASFAYSNFKWGWKTFKLWPFDIERLKKDNYIHTTSLMHRDAFSGFDESLKRLQDWDLWLTITEQGKTGVWIPWTLFQISTARGTMSKWFPKFLYHFKTKQAQTYEQAKQIVKIKHHLF